MTNIFKNYKVYELVKIFILHFNYDRYIISEFVFLCDVSVGKNQKRLVVLVKNYVLV